MFGPSVAEIVIHRFGGLTALARALGHKHPSTVQRWRKTGNIPRQHWPAVEKAAFATGDLSLTARWLGQAHADQENRRADETAREAAAKKNNEAAAETIAAG